MWQILFDLLHAAILFRLSSLDIFICEQKDPKTGELEGLSFDFNLCEALATWEQVSMLFCLP